jgi:peptidoglycan/xylan/chitin deacetylase (PgdA/CDA1 family)
VTLTAAEKQVWAPLPADRSAIPVLLYHGIGPASDFANSADASYGVDVIDFAKQMTMIKHAGYQTVSLQTFIDFVEGKNVKLPRRPLLLTFDDARADSYTGSDGILKKLGFNAVMFADVGRVDDGDPEYLTWDELRTMASSGRWDMQLHSGHGHVYIQYDSSDPAVTGPYYAYQKPGEDLDAWKKRVTGDIEWGEQQLSRQIPGIQPLAFSPPYGSYGQDGTNDPSIPGALLGYLTDRFHVVFTQDENARAKPGAPEPLGRIQVTRAVAGGDLYERLLSGKN